MNKYISYLLTGAALLAFSSCTDFLDREPEAQLIPENFFTDATNLAAYTQNFYTIFPSHSDNSYGLGTFSTDNGTDNQAQVSASSRWIPGQWLVPTESGNWNFTTLRQVNYFLANTLPNYEAGSISGSAELIEQSIGEAYFFRAFNMYRNYKELGDFPIITEVLPDDKELLLEKSVRYPRNQVARQILSDLTLAAQYLPDNNSKGKNGLNKMCAYLLRSRVALFEGTWLKYHKGTALVPGGPGWPGDQSMLNGFNIDTEINYFLTEAMASAKIVGDWISGNLVENTGSLIGENAQYVSLNPYYTMFCEQDLSGYSEVLLFKYYNLSLQVYSQIQNQFQNNAGGTGWTRGLVNAFVMRNGLPIYASGSGYNSDWENEGITATLQDRDNRIQIFTKEDDCIDTYNMQTGEPVYFAEGHLLDGDTQTRAVTGFAIKKGKGYNFAEATGNNASVTGSIIFRAVEAMLNYMEACVELNGAVDGTAAQYWRAIRNRAYVNPDFNTTIAATQMSQEALGDWGAYSAGNLIAPTLYNVRRERRCELIAEALRLDDLRRWAALDQLITTPYIIEGMKYWGTVYNDPDSPLHLYQPGDETKTYLAPIVSPETGTGTMSPEENSPYVRPYQITKLQNLVWDGYTFTRAHYLSPIGQKNFTDASTDGTIATSVIYQNPGWSKNAGDPASNID